jgi:very-short-patch-repair endonuclease
MHPNRVQKTYQDLYEETGRRAKALEDQGYTVVSIWEHEFDRLVEQNTQLYKFI